MMSYKRIWQSTTVALALLTTAPPAYAYLDPSTASMVISAIVGLLATASLVVKTYWYKLKSFFRNDKTAESETDEQSSPDADGPLDS